MTTVILTTADSSPWTVPADWVDAGSRVICIAAGGGGRSGGAAAGAAGTVVPPVEPPTTDTLPVYP